MKWAFLLNTQGLDNYDFNHFITILPFSGLHKEMQSYTKCQNKTSLSDKYWCSWEQSSQNECSRDELQLEIWQFIVYLLACKHRYVKHMILYLVYINWWARKRLTVKPQHV